MAFPRPRILYLVTQDSLGGAQRYVLLLARAFRDRAETAVATGADGDGWLSGAARTDGIPVRRFPRLRRRVSPADDLATARELRALLASGEWDVLHVNSTKAGVLAGLAALGMPRTQSRTRIVYTAHGWVFLEPLPLLRKAFYFLMEFIAARGRDATVVLGGRERRIARRFLRIRADRLSVIPHGIPPATGPRPGKEEARRLLALPDDALPVVGTVANLYPTKGVDVLLDAFAATALKDLPFRLVIVGDGPERPALERLAAARGGARDDIRLVGRLPDASRILPAFDLFILPSRKEGLPFVLLEALDAGLPVVATDVGAVRETLGDAGVIVPPRDPDVLASAIARLLKDENARRDSADASRRRAAALAARHGRMLEETWRRYGLTAQAPPPARR